MVNPLLYIVSSFRYLKPVLRKKRILLLKKGLRILHGISTLRVQSVGRFSSDASLKLFGLVEETCLFRVMMKLQVHLAILIVLVRLLQ